MRQNSMLCVYSVNKKNKMNQILRLEMEREFELKLNDLLIQNKISRNEYFELYNSQKPVHPY